MNNNLKQVIEKSLSDHVSDSVQITGIRSAGGGCINEAAVVDTNRGKFFAKWNDAKRYPGMFEAEAKGLQLLDHSKCVAVPELIGVLHTESTSCLLMANVISGVRQANFSTDFGRGLAAMHKHTADTFGLDHDNYIGSLPQYNKPHTDWTSFFASMRLEVQSAMAFDSGKIGNQHLKRLQSLYKRFEDIFPNEPPALLHGDLWGGNYMTGPDGKAVVFDPAVYYGHREMDLGMSKLFGGFEAPFYDAYNETYPLEKGWQHRTDICNLYPMFVHLNLFGLSYLSGIDAVLRRF